MNGSQVLPTMLKQQHKKLKVSTSNHSTDVKQIAALLVMENLVGCCFKLLGLGIKVTDQKRTFISMFYHNFLRTMLSFILNKIWLILIFVVISFISRPNFLCLRLLTCNYDFLAFSSQVPST